MKKGNLLGCAMLVMCQLSLAQVSRDSAYEFLKTNILPNNWNEKEINICVSPNLVPENSVITALGIGFDTFAISPNYKTWFFYVDEEPISQWHRKCKYVFINDENNFVIIDMTTPPNYTGMIPLHIITPRFIEADTSSWKKKKEVKNLSVSNINYTDCLSESKDTFSKDLSDPDSIVYSYQNHTMYITHHNLTVGCGEEVHVDVQLINDTIRISEWTDGYVDCVCKIDNSFQINDLEKGSYILYFINPEIVLPINL